LGGAVLLRSPAMPPWRGEFSETEIESIILHIHALRQQRHEEVSNEARR
jgi:hypothetical protein